MGFMYNAATISEEFKVAFKNREIPLRNKQERYSRVPRLSDTRYSVKGPKENGDMPSPKRD